VVSVALWLRMPVFWGVMSCRVAWLMLTGVSKENFSLTLIKVLKKKTLGCFETLANTNPRTQGNIPECRNPEPVFVFVR
jgi:hypothetical protein